MYFINHGFAVRIQIGIQPARKLTKMGLSMLSRELYVKSFPPEKS